MRILKVTVIVIASAATLIVLGEAGERAQIQHAARIVTDCNVPL